jgi:hypothetical protein
MANKEDPSKEKSSKPTLYQVLISVLGAVLGVQSSSVRERDFTRGHHWWVYLTIGTITALIIVLLLIGIVKLTIYIAS